MHESTESRWNLDTAYVRILTGLSSLEGVLACKINGRSFNIRVEEMCKAESEFQSIQLYESESEAGSGLWGGSKHEDLESIEAHVGDWHPPAKTVEKSAQGATGASVPAMHANPVVDFETWEGGKTVDSNHEGQGTLVSRVSETRERILDLGLGLDVLDKKRGMVGFLMGQS